MRKLIPTLAAVLFSMTVNAQIKIGNITIDNRTAEKYFLYCYSHPDTVCERNAYSYLPCENCIIRGDDFDKAKALADSFNEQLHRDAISEYKGDGWEIPKRFLVPRKPSEVDFIKWKARKI
jgi:hypothetical protein